METRKKEKVYIQLCHPDAVMPQYADEEDAGADISVCEDVNIKSGETILAPLGFKVAIPRGYELQLRPRSGLSYKTSLRIPNSPGTIDTNYRDELKAILHNTGDEEIVFKKGDRIGQLVLNEVPKAEYTLIEDINEIEGNRGGGFGSSKINVSELKKNKKK